MAFGTTNKLTLMFFVKAPNLGWGLMTSSGTYAEFAMGPCTRGPPDLASRGDADLPPLSGAATKSPTPMRGKQVIVGAISPGRNTLRMRLRRRRMLRSTYAPNDTRIKEAPTLDGAGDTKAKTFKHLSCAVARSPAASMNFVLVEHSHVSCRTSVGVNHKLVTCDAL